MIIHIHAFLRHMEARGASDATLDAYGRDLAAFARHLEARGCREPHDLTPEHAPAYLAHIAPDLAAASRSRKLASLRGFIGWLGSAGLTHVPPPSRQGTDSAHRPWTLAPVAWDVMLAAAGELGLGTRDRAIAMLLLHGLGTLEALALDREHLDLEAGTLAVGVGVRRRAVNLASLEREALFAYCNGDRLAPARKGRSEALFLTMYGHRLQRQVVWRMVASVLGRQACSADLTPHALRRAYIEHQLALGTDHLDLARRAGIGVERLQEAERQLLRRRTEVAGAAS